MLSSKPILVMANGEVQTVVKNARCGYYTGADSIDKMVRLVLSISNYSNQELEERVETDIIITSGILRKKNV